MIKKKLLISFILLLVIFKITGQYSDKVYFKDVNGFKLENLNKRINQASIQNKSEKSKELFNKLINKYIKGKYLSNYDFLTIDNNILSTDKIDKPILLLARMTLNEHNWREISILNDIIEKYETKIEIIILYWDKNSELKNITSQYDKRIHLIPSDEFLIDKTKITHSGFEHKLDYPSAYLIDKDKKIIDFTRGIKIATEKRDWNETTELNKRNLINFIYPVIK